MGRALRANNRRPIQTGVAGVFLFALLLSSFNSNVAGQEGTAFNPQDRFDIPQLNGSINFAYNGSYTQATLEDNTWHFRGLILNGSRSLGDFSVSVQDSNITISSLSAPNSSQSRRFVRYYAEGAGQQIFDLGVKGSTHVSEWWVTLPGGVFLAPGRDWQLLDGNIISVTGQTGNVSVVHNNFGLDERRSLSFVEQHSVALTAGAIVAVTVTAAALLRIKRGRLNGY